MRKPKAPAEPIELVPSRHERHMRKVAQAQLEALERIASALERLTYLARAEGMQKTFDFNHIGPLLEASERADVLARLGVRTRLGIYKEPDPDSNN